jgi:transposase
MVAMQLTRSQFEQVAPWLPRQRGNVRLDNFEVVNAILYVAANGCKWRALPAHYGPWHTLYMRMSRWAKAGVLDRLFEQLQRQRLMHVRIEAVSLDSTIVKVHPDGTGAPKKTVRRPLAAAEAAGVPSFIWLPRLPAMSSPGA